MYDIRDMEQGEGTPRARVQIQTTFHHERQDLVSENDYGDDEGSMSDSSAVLSSRNSFENFHTMQTPLLSSSLPYDPDQDHPHQRQASFSTLGEGPALLNSSVLGDSEHDLTASRMSAIETDDEDDDDRGDIVTVHEDDEERAETEAQESEPLANHEWHPEPSSSTRSPRRRTYPSWPPYSSSYNQNHFPHALNPSTAAAAAPSISGSTIRHVQNQRRRIYGISVDRLPAYLPIMWRVAALFMHIGHSIWFAWAPALIYRGRFQWWCFLVVLILAVRKAWNTVEWFGGTASR